MAELIVDISVRLVNSQNISQERFSVNKGTTRRIGDNPLFFKAEAGKTLDELRDAVAGHLKAEFGELPPKKGEKA